MKIMIVEDDLSLAREICLLCRKWEFDSTYLRNFEQVDEAFMRLKPDFVLLDINLPHHDGFYWCEKIRNLSNVPILFLSSRELNADKIMAMASGGDDYMEKPFDSELLLVKIRSMLRRAYEYQKNDREYLADGAYYDSAEGIFTYGDRTAELTKSENKIMNALLEDRGKVVEREKLMQQLWNTDEFVTDASLTVLVSRLRSKLRDISGGKEIIGTKKGRGYYIL